MSEIFSEVLEKRVLLVGYSEINRRFRAFLEHRGMCDVTFCTRAWGRGREELARWSEYDLICCATQADGYLVQGQGNKRHLIFDLSVPRNVDPEVGKSATLYNIEQINHLIEQKAPYSLEQGEAMIEEHAARLTTLYREKVERCSEFELVIH